MNKSFPRPFQKTLNKNLFHTFSLLGRLGFVMVASVLAGGAVGFVLQKKLGFTSPTLTVLGVVLGVWVGLRQTYRAIMKTMPEEHSEEKRLLSTEDTDEHRK